MSSLNSLRKALQPPPLVYVPAPRNDYQVPVFSSSEIEEINQVKAEAETYSKYGEEGWFDKLVQEETVLASDSLDGCIDPLEVLISHWTDAVEIGKLNLERHIVYNKALSVANVLESHGLVEMKSVHYYLGCAMNQSLPAGIGLSRLTDILTEFQKALNAMRRACMCKMAPCCCSSG